jgi:hypothetical protein
MPTLKTAGSGGDPDYDAIPNEEVIAVSLADVEERTQTFRNDETGQPEEVDRLRWSFIVTEPGPYQGRTVTGMTSTAFTSHPNCKAYQWASALSGGYQFAPDETLDTDDLVSKPARVLIKHNVKDGRVYENVVNVLQARPGGTTGAITSPAQTTATDTPF